MRANTTLSCCALLQSLHLPLALPNTPLYNTALSSYWSAQEASLHPSCITTPTTTTTLSAILAALAPHTNCPLAIKAGGHAPAAGFANTNNGVTIDLSALSTVSLSADAAIASIGTGATWVSVYAALATHNVTVPGGRNGRVGVGGLVLGGGISYFSPQVGFACDAVVNYEVVLASGRVVDANASSHADLFRALKGGLGNFGVVSRVDMRTVGVPEGVRILGGRVVNDVKDRGEVFEAFAGIAGAEVYDVHASITTSAVFNASGGAKKWTLLSAPIYTLPETEPVVYRELFSIPQVSSTLQITPLHVLANESRIPQTNQLFRTGTYGVSAELLERIFDVANETLYGFEVSGSLQWILTFEPLPTVFVTHGEGKNVLGLSAADGNAIVLLVSASWSNADSNSLVYAAADELLRRINDVARTMGLLRDFVYANYAGLIQDPVANYGAQNQEFLRKVASKYDPTGFFQTRVLGGFKLDG